MYQVSIIQRIKYTETIIGVFNTFEEIAAFLASFAEHFQFNEIKIEPVKTEEIEEVAEE